MNILPLLQIPLSLALLALAYAGALRPRLLAVLQPLVPASRWARLGIAALCALAGIATLAGAAVPFVAFFASVLALAAALACAVNVRGAKAARLWLAPAFLAITSIAVAMIQPLGLKVLALPKADELPYAPVEARVVKTYDEGVWFEGIAAAPDGTLYLAANRGLDFSRADYYRQAEGEIIARALNGDERVVFRTPKGSAAGVPAIAADGKIFMTSNGDEPGVFRIGRDGAGSLFARMPRGAWPNGLDFGPDGKLYSPDSHLGVVWRIDPATGNVEKALEDARLLARPFISLAPGANGLHFIGRRMIVTVSDRTTVLDYELRAGGSFNEPKVLATGIPGDDFAVGRDGSLFVTTHPYDTIVRVSPSGERSVIGNSKQRVIGATDAVFGRTDADRDTLYVVTDGGAFTGGSKSRGELLTLKPY